MKMSNEGDRSLSVSSLKAERVEEDLKRASAALSECLFSQYRGFVAGVVMATGYSLVRKPANGVGIMLISAAAGTLADGMYGWNIGCRSEVIMWQRYSHLHFQMKAADGEKPNDASASTGEVSFQDASFDHVPDDNNSNPKM